MEKVLTQKQVRLLLTMMLALIAVLPANAQQAAPTNKQAAGADVTVVTAAGPTITRLLPEVLAGVKATGDTRLFTPDELSSIVAEKSPIYQEYRVISAASSEYAGVRVDVFETQNRFAAFGLFTFDAGAGKSKPVDGIGAGAAQLEDSLLFSKGNFFVRVSDTRKKP